MFYHLHGELGLLSYVCVVHALCCCGMRRRSGERLLNLEFVTNYWSHVRLDKTCVLIMFCTVLDKENPT